MTNTTNATQLLLSNIDRYYMNPSSIIDDNLNVLEMLLNGQDIVDGTSPFIFLLEASCTNTAAAISKGESVVRRLYPLLAQTPSDLYGHMSDTDFIGVYSMGATGTIEILLPYQQLMQNAIPNGSGVNIVVIPRDTIVTVNNIDLGIVYPIVINVINSSIIQVTYDTTLNSPLMTLTTNSLANNILVYQGTKYLQITVPVLQYANDSYIFTLTNTSAFTQNITFVDSYFYARVYMTTGTSWTEIKTTLSPIVYDINVVTALLAVVGNTLTVTIPDIYQSLALVGTSIRIDIFTSKGLLDIDLSQIPVSNFSALWQDFDTLKVNPGVAPLSNLNDIIIFSTSALSGGNNALTFSQLQQKVIYNSNITAVPIRFSDIVTKLDQLGYNTKILIDNITNKVYLSSKNLPARIVNSLSVTPLCINAIVQFNLDTGLVGGGYNLSILTSGTNRSTILPSAIYSEINGNVTVLSDAEINNLNSLSPSNLSISLNETLYMYSPFHYVIDYTHPILTVRPYYLQKPIIYGGNYINSNPNRNYNISTLSSTLSLNGNVYTLVLTTTIPSGITGVLCQISYVNEVSGETVYINGVQTLGVNVAYFTFTFTTNFDISSTNQIEIFNMFNRVNSSTPIFVNLTDTFNIFYLIAGNITGLTTNFDNLYFISTGMPSSVIGATQESVTIVFGQQLSNLYCYSAETVVAPQYQKYTSVVYATYSETIYSKDISGNYLFTINQTNINAGSFVPNTIYKIVTLGTTNWGLIGWTSANSVTGVTTPLVGDTFIATGKGSGTGVASTGTVVFTVQYNIGDNVLDSNGNPIILHNIGDLILESNGNPIPAIGSVSTSQQLVGITLIDAKYKIWPNATTAPLTVSYIDTLADTIVGFLVDEIAPISKQLNERSVLLYVPSGEPYQLQVYVGSGNIVTVNSTLSIQITFSLTDESVNNSTIENNITTIARTIITNTINQTVISKSNFISTLKDACPSDVIGLSIDTFLPGNYEVVTLVDPTVNFNIQQNLVVLPDGTIDIQDNVILLFKSAK